MDTIRQNIQPITQNLPDPVRNLAVSLLGAPCYESLVLDINLEDKQCLLLATSKALGVAIVATSAIVKLPQLFKIVQARSGAGISFLAYALETAALLVNLAYSSRSGFPFSTYGETALISLQNIAITLLVLHYGRNDGGAAAFVAAIASGMYALFSDNIVDMKMLALLQAAGGVLGVSSKIPQIWTIWQQGSTGQLSAFAVRQLNVHLVILTKFWQVFNYLLGSLARVFTTLREVDDKLILYSYLAGLALNAVLTVQMLYYWNQPTKKQKIKKRK